MIGIAKKTYKYAIKKQKLSIKQFLTLLTEIEAVINLRPLPYISN